MIDERKDERLRLASQLADTASKLSDRWSDLKSVPQSHEFAAIGRDFAKLREHLRSFEDVSFGVYHAISERREQTIARFAPGEGVGVFVPDPSAHVWTPATVMVVTGSGLVSVRFEDGRVQTFDPEHVRKEPAQKTTKKKGISFRRDSKKLVSKPDSDQPDKPTR